MEPITRLLPRGKHLHPSGITGHDLCLCLFLALLREAARGRNTNVLLIAFVPCKLLNTIQPQDAGLMRENMRLKKRL